MTDDIEVKPQKHYVSFKKEGRSIVSVELQQRNIKLYVNVKSGSLDDPKGLARDVASIGHYASGDYEVKAMDDRNLEYIMSLVKQAL